MSSKNVYVNPPDGWKNYAADLLILKGARLFDSSNGIDKIDNLILKDGIIAGMGAIPDGWEGIVLDMSGFIICPGFFDLHVHLREPGYEYKETVQSGCLAAAAGGFTGVAPMPNTNPATDTVGIVNFVRERAAGLPVEVFPAACLTVGRAGESLTDIGELYEAGVRMFSDDGSPLTSADLMRHALEYTSMFDAVISEHCEDLSLTHGGVMHEGATSTKLGLPGLPGIGEEIAVERNIRLAEYTGGHIHIAHISTAKSLDLIRRAKQEGLNVTAEVTPHHLTLDCTLLSGYDSNLKVNPPLRTRDDCEALIEGLADGTIDAIATDHAPHAPDEKEVEFIHAPFGMIGLETALGVVHTELVLKNKLSLERMVEALSIKPREIMRLPEIAIKTGMQANLTIFNPEENWMVDRDISFSKSKNTPFHGWNLTGKAVGIVNSGIAWIREL